LREEADSDRRAEEAYQIDKRCRWVLPLAYFGSLGLAAIYFFVRF